VTDDFIGRLATDSVIGRFFAGHSKDSQLRIRQLIVDQTVRSHRWSMRVHRSQPEGVACRTGITGAEWDRAVRLLVATLNKFTVPAAEQTEVLAAISTLKPDIVEKS
jgi:truncated hemoglobin YjbI